MIITIHEHVSLEIILMTSFIKYQILVQIFYHVYPTTYTSDREIENYMFRKSLTCQWALSLKIKIEILDKLTLKHNLHQIKEGTQALFDVYINCTHLIKPTDMPKRNTFCCSKILLPVNHLVKTIKVRRDHIDSQNYSS